MRVNPNYLTNLATSLDQSQAAQQELTSQLSSGVRVNSLSQDAVSAGENVLLLNQIQQDDSFTLSSSMVTGKLQVADSALGSVVSQLTQAISLATAANNGTMNASNVESISNQIAGILGEVTTLANTSYQGQFIFAGGQTSAAPFTTSNATSPAVTSYTGDGAINYLQMPNGQKDTVECARRSDILGHWFEQRLCSPQQPGGRLFQRHSGHRKGHKRHAGLEFGSELRIPAARCHRQLHYPTNNCFRRRDQ